MLVPPHGNISNPRVLSDMGLAIPTWMGFEQYLKAQKKRNVRQILCYARRYHDVLETGDASVIASLSSGALRRHAMEALTVYAKYSGSYENWCYIRRRYSLRWTNGDESIQALQRFFNPSLSFDTMLQRIREMMDKTPPWVAEIIKFACLVGLRPSEVLESVRLICLSTDKYYNPEREALEHFRFAEIFIRQTKKTYLSYITLDNLQPIVNLGCKPPVPQFSADTTYPQITPLRPEYCRLWKSCKNNCKTVSVYNARPQPFI
jgi:hypothetical protein